MTGTTAGNSLESDGARLRTGPLNASPPAADVEAELQRIARQRLAPPSGPGSAANEDRRTRSFRHRHQPLVGAFDSPEGFAFTSR